MPNGDTLEVRVGTLEQAAEVIKTEHRNCRKVQDERHDDMRRLIEEQKKDIKAQDKKLWGIIILLGGLIAALLPIALKSL